MEDQARNDNYRVFHYSRPRLYDFFCEAVEYPLVVVNAGAGYGKTSAVHDFVQEYQATTAWVQLSERDNVGARFWENFTHSLTQINAPLARAMTMLGFPDTREKIKKYLALLHEHVQMKRRIIVMDDFHCIEEPFVIRFVEECVLHGMPPGTSVFLVSRSSPRINIAGLVYRGQIFNMSESDLRFTESELAQYFHQMEISLQPDNMREIMRDTEGWAFAINLIARSFQKAPGYGGYIRNAMKTNIFRLMETEIWDGISGYLQNFLVRLSLIDHLSVDLLSQLTAGEEGLIAELERQSAYMRQDSYINAYLIHPLFLEFLRTKQDTLTDEQKHETYKIAGDWCNKNGFKIDALSYYEKTGNYESMVSILSEWPSQIPPGIAKIMVEILDRAPPGAFDTVEYLAVLHFRAYTCHGLWQKSVELAEHYEAKFLRLPDPPAINTFKNRTLSHLYYNWAILRGMMGIVEDRYDHYLYHEKFCKYCPQPIDTRIFHIVPGPWIIGIGSSRKGAPEEYIEAMSRIAANTVRYFKGYRNGHKEIARGELLFFQGDTVNAEPYFAQGLELALEQELFDIAHRALLYILRIGIAQGDYQKADQAMKKTKSHLEINKYANRYINHDISLSLYYCILNFPEKAPDWLKQDFSSYEYASFIENFANQMKARFCYITRNFPPLLSYIQEMKQRESVLFGRIEMLAMEACVHYQTRDKKKALAALSEAFKIAAPNNIIMPFVELGKDMRSLTSAVLKEKSSQIPKAWLKNVNRKSASYAKHRFQIITEYRQARPRESAFVAVK